jgi:hypothetical protein
MVFHPSLNFDIARQRHQELLAQGERQRLATASRAARDDRSGSSTEVPVRTTNGRRRRPFPAKRATS